MECRCPIQSVWTIFLPLTYPNRFCVNNFYGICMISCQKIQCTVISVRCRISHWLAVSKKTTTQRTSLRFQNSKTSDLMRLQPTLEQNHVQCKYDMRQLKFISTLLALNMTPADTSDSVLCSLRQDSRVIPVALQVTVVLEQN